MLNRIREPLRRMSRRTALATLAIPLAAFLPPAYAVTWTPLRPIRLLVPYGPGGSSDAIARVIAAEMSKGLGQQIVVDNKGGGQGVIAMQEAARAAPDGYTLVLGHVGTLAVNPAMMRKLPYDPEKDFAPVTLLAKVPMVFVVGPSAHSDSIRAFITQAKSKPGAMTYGSAGNGSAGNVAFEMLKQTAHIDLVHVPYRGTGALITDLLAGNIDAASAGLAGVLQHAKAGKLRILAVGSTKRLAQLPNVPTIAEEGYPEFESSQWFGLMAPAGTPSPVVARLHAEALKALATPLVRQRLAEDASTPVGAGSTEFASFIRIEQLRWGTVIRSAGIQGN